MGFNFSLGSKPWSEFPLQTINRADAASDQQCAAVGTQSPAKIMDIAFLASFKAAYFGTSHNPLTAPRKYVIVL